MLAVVCGTEKSLPSIPRSKGCLNCTSRRKRCDGRRPTCKTCEERMEACRGYRRSEFAFLNEGWRTLGVAKGGRTKRKVAKQTPGKVTSVCLSPESAQPPLALQRNPPADRTLLYTTFFLSEFATYLLPNPHVIASLFSSYFSLLPLQSSTNPKGGLNTPVVYAVDALAQGHFGKATADESSMQQSVKKYGMALRSMRSTIEDLSLDDTGVKRLPEDEWQNLAFFCLTMAFWELRMAPDSQNWQNHVRALSDAIVLRGSSHTFSKSNIELIATSRLLITLQSMSSRQPGRLNDHEWLGYFSIPENWMEPIKRSKVDKEDPIFKLEGHTSADLLESLMSHIESMVSLMAEFDQLAIQLSTKGPTARRNGIKMQLLNLYKASEQALEHSEAHFAPWETTLSHEVPSEDYLLCPHSDEPTDFWWKNQLWPTFSHAIGSLFYTLLSFSSTKAHHAVSLFWTTAMSLHLLVLDILSLMIREGLPSIPENAQDIIRRTREKLVCYATRVIRGIPFIGQLGKRCNAPFFLATSFQVAIFVISRECTILKEENIDGHAVERLESMKELAARFLNWLEWNKITLTVDTNSLRGRFPLAQ